MLLVMFKCVTLTVLLAATPVVAEPELTRIDKVVATKCSTDGGAMNCPSGVKYMGELIQKWGYAQLLEKPQACPGAKPGPMTFGLGYEYNDGQIYIADESKLPGCVKSLATKLGAKWLEIYKFIQPLDPSVDVRNTYKITVMIRK